MVWLGQTAIPSVARYARIPSPALETAARRLASTEGTICTTKLSAEFSVCEKEQPALARWMGKALAVPLDDTARGLGASLAVTIWSAFRLTVGDRLRRLTQEDCDAAEQLLRADEELRRSDAKVGMESDDVIALHQPEIASFIRARLEDTMVHFANDIDVDDVDTMYRMLLVEVLALSYAVLPPPELQMPAGRYLS